MRAHDEYNIEETALEGILSPGRADWVEQPAAGIGHTLRLWPHLLRGEGHYIARLRKQGQVTDKKPVQGAGDKKLCKLIERFMREELGIGDAWIARHPGRLVRFGEQIYLMPAEMTSLEGLRILRPGLQLATEKKNRFEPAHALALTLLPGDSSRMYGLSGQEAAAYLRGESLACGEQRGWTVLSYEGYALGFGKASGGQMKNHYPKGLRKSL